VPVFALFVEGPETLVDALARILNFRLTRGELLEGKLPILGVLRRFLRWRLRYLQNTYLQNPAAG
jgi:hypothetical protein